MRKLAVILFLFSFTNAKADVERTKQCTSVLNNMTELIYNYVDTIKACRELEAEGKMNTRAYEGYKRIARKTEATYSRGKALCFQVCDDTFFCEGDGLSGACLK